MCNRKERSYGKRFDRPITIEDGNGDQLSFEVEAINGKNAYQVAVEASLQ